MKKIIIVLVLVYTYCDNIRLYDTTGHLEFTQTADYKLVLKEYEKEIPDFFLKNAFVSIKLKVKSDTKDKTQPIRIYGKLNSQPEPENIIYDKKDILGIYDSDSETFLYGYEYSPCQLSLNDTIYIKLVAIEGKSNYTLTVNFNYLKNYRTLCTTGQEPPLSQYSASVLTKLGTITYGGKYNNTLDDHLYLLNDTNWIKINPLNKGPAPRYGHLITEFNDHLIVFGGKNQNETSMNDLWIYDLYKNRWLNIDYHNRTNVPKNKFLPSCGLIKNYGKLLIYGDYNIDDKNVYFLNLKILFEIADYLNYSSNYTKSNFDYVTKLHNLWSVVEINDLLPRYGLSITHLGGNEVMFYGGIDLNGYSLSRLEILNIDNFQVNNFETHSLSESPSARGFHSIIKIGSILLLYGGRKGTGESFNDIWKFLIYSKKWIKVKETKEDLFYLHKSNFIFTKIKRMGDRPVMYLGEDNNREITNDVIVLDFDICMTDTNILDSTDCIPCSEGYELNRQKKCSICSPGYFHEYNNQFYSDSKCNECPEKTYNTLYGQSDCLICPFSKFNNKTGQAECQECENGKICLTGSNQPIYDDFLVDHVYDSYIEDINYPEYVDKNNIIKKNAMTIGLITIGSILLLMIIVLLIIYKINKNRVTKFLICMDFLVLTGGQTKKCNGGLITIIYGVLMLSFTLTFIIRYIFINELIEVIPLSHLTNEQAIIQSSLKLDVDLIGYKSSCIDSKLEYENYFTCSNDIDLTDSKKKVDKIYCSITEEGFCRLTFICEDCKKINNTDSITFNLNNLDSYVQIYEWNLKSVWNILLDDIKGFSEIRSIFKPDNNIKSNYLFKGKDPSIIKILFTPVYYTSSSTDEKLSGYRTSLKEYKRGSIRNDLDLKRENDGVSLQFQFFYSTNSYQINSKRRIEFLDFYAFILGSLAGYSFLSRISKFICESCNVFNYSYENYQEFQDDIENKKEKLDGGEFEMKNNEKKDQIT